jgi:hypothetical protein
MSFLFIYLQKTSLRQMNAINRSELKLIFRELSLQTRFHFYSLELFIQINYRIF